VTLLNFDTPLDAAGVTRLTTTIPAPTNEITVVPVREASRLDLIQDADTIGWDGLRDYVVHEIEQRFGPFPRDPRKEASIFKSFVARWGAKAMPIAKAAFEVYNGYWHSSPISVNRFCKGSDPYFAQPISERIHSATVQAWT
jgi:hypothetical protein